MTLSSSLSGSVIRVNRMNVACLIPRQHSSPGLIRAKLIDIAEKQLSASCASLLRPLCPQEDRSVWFIRRLDVDVAVDPGWDADRLARAWSQPLARTLMRTVTAEPEGENALRFASRGAYLVQFLRDLADGVAWSKWYYADFDGLRALPSPVAVREAICREPADGDTALQLLALEGGFEKVIGVMKDTDCGAVLAALCRGGDEGDITSAHLRAAMQSWSRARADEGSAERGGLRLFVALRCGEGALPASAALRVAIRSLLALARWMSAPLGGRLLAALQQGDSTAAFALVGGSEVEVLMPLLRCERDVVAGIAEQLRAQTRGKLVRRSHETGEPLLTSFGGAFLLLPRLAELDLESCAAALPEFEEASPVPLVRFLVLLKCLGRPRAPQAFFDPVLRELTGVSQSLDAEAVRAWARRITPEMSHDFQARWAASCCQSGIDAHCWLRVHAARRGRVLLLAGGDRNTWLGAVRSADELARVVKAIHDSLADGDASPLAILCDPPVVSLLRATSAGLTVYTTDSAEATMLRSKGAVLGSSLQDLGSPDDDLTYFNLTSLLRGARHLDLALSLPARSAFRAFARRLPGFALSSANYLYANFLNVSAAIDSEADRWHVRLARPPLHIVLTMTGATRDEYKIAWLDERRVKLMTDQS